MIADCTAIKTVFRLTKGSRTLFFKLVSTSESITALLRELVSLSFESDASSFESLGTFWMYLKHLASSLTC